MELSFVTARARIGAARVALSRAPTDKLSSISAIQSTALIEYLRRAKKALSAEDVRRLSDQVTIYQILYVIPNCPSSIEQVLIWIVVKAGSSSALPFPI